VRNAERRIDRDRLQLRGVCGGFPAGVNERFSKVSKIVVERNWSYPPCESVRADNFAANSETFRAGSERVEVTRHHGCAADSITRREE
jgi:hypothetical protein